METAPAEGPRGVFHWPRLLGALSIAFAVAAVWSYREAERQSDLVRAARHPARIKLNISGLRPGESVEARMTRQSRLWQTPPEPWSSQEVADVDGRLRFLLPEGAFDIVREDGAIPWLAIPGGDETIELAPSPAGFARVPPGPGFARLTFDIVEPLDPRGSAHGPRGFLISRTEVSVTEYRRFLGALRTLRKQPGEGAVEPRNAPLPFGPFCSEEEKSASPRGCLGHRPVTGGADQWDRQLEPELIDGPLRFASWFDALAYCRWLESESGGGRHRLPTRSEWEKAARGVDGRPFPWGWDPLTPARRALLGAQLRVDSHHHLDSPHGLHHTGSGVAEWVHDLDGERRRTVMGMSWDVHSDQIHLGYGVGESPFLRASSIGFRVLREEPR